MKGMAKVQINHRIGVVDLVVGEPCEVAGWGWVTPIPRWDREGYRATLPVPEKLARRFAAVVAAAKDAEAALRCIREVFTEGERAAICAE